MKLSIIFCVQVSKSSTPEQKGQISKKVGESISAKFGRLSLGSKNPGGQGKEAAGRSRKMSIA
jgi:hypothetical protein